MTWIKTVSYQQASGALKRLYERIKGPDDNVDGLRNAGFDDGEILEVNQVAAYFAYANRTVLGLGINTDGDIIGLSPGENADPNSWSHR